MTLIIRTVAGDIDPVDAGVTLFHEHVGADFGRWFGEPDASISGEVVMIAELGEAGRAGIGMVVDCTTPEIGGREAADLLPIANQSGVRLVASTGLYLEQTYPAFVRDETAAQLADRFIRDVTEGIAGSGIRAGVFGEIGSSPGGITESERKVFRAVGLANVATGAPVVTHTPNGENALEQLEILMSVGVNPGRVAIGHVDCIADRELHREIARLGAFVGFDRIGLSRYQSDAERIEFVLAMFDAGLQDHVLLSSDLARNSRLKRSGGRGYAEVIEHFLPALEARGVSESSARKIVTDNAVRLLAFTPLR